MEEIVALIIFFCVSVSCLVLYFLFHRLENKLQKDKEMREEQLYLQVCEIADSLNEIRKVLEYPVGYLANDDEEPF